MHPGRFMGFSWNIGDPITFKVPHCNTNPYKRNMVVHRGVVVPHTLTSTGYIYALAPKSDTYFPEVQLKSGLNNLPAASEHQGTVDSPDIYISEGGGKASQTL